VWNMREAHVPHHILLPRAASPREHPAERAKTLRIRHPLNYERDDSTIKLASHIILQDALCHIHIVIKISPFQLTYVER